MMWIAEIVMNALAVIVITFGCTAFIASAFFGYPEEREDDTV
jgi:hypothetical protein